MSTKIHHPPSTCPNRRRFLRAAGFTGAGLLAAGCQALSGAQIDTPQARSATPPPSATPTLTQAPSATPLPTATRTLIPPSPTPLPHSAVGLGRVTDYDPKRVRAGLESLLDGIGGLGDVVRPGTRVAIKVNLTGGTMWQRPNETPATEVFVTHPVVVGALCELLCDAGASKIYIVEGVYEWESYTLWGFDAAVKDTGAELVDLNWYAPFKGFAQVAVGGQPQLYEQFTFNPVLEEIDVFVSAAKMKTHFTAGVTHTLKNLVGLAPLGLYRSQESHNYRSALHGGTAQGFDSHLIRGILDLNQARPIHLAVIDGITTCDGGEGPWQKIDPVSPGVLVVGKDPVAADSVATAVMGFDPQAAALQPPFIRSENYLALANDLGLGTNRLAEIPVVGERIEDVMMGFKVAG